MIKDRVQHGLNLEESFPFMILVGFPVKRDGDEGLHVSDRKGEIESRFFGHWSRFREEEERRGEMRKTARLGWRRSLT